VKREQSARDKEELFQSFHNDLSGGWCDLVFSRKVVALESRAGLVSINNSLY
jgi:hypothetical protein